MVDVAEGAGPVDRLHNLLLVLTGRVDDDAVNSARGMLGAGQLDAAAELVVGCLLAGRIPVTPSEQYHLRRVLEEARSQRSLADRLQVVEMPPTEQHRFGEPETADHDIAEALRPVARRLTSVRALWCVSRVTPAGVAYGAVPRRVLLAEVGSEGAVAAAGYQILEALDRAGIGCSVDVFSTGTDLPDYHRSALASARQVPLDPSATAAANRTTPGGSSRARAPRRSSDGEPAAAGVADTASESPARVPSPEPEPPAAAPHAPEPPAAEPPAAEVVPEPPRHEEIPVSGPAVADVSSTTTMSSVPQAAPEDGEPGGPDSGVNSPRVPAAVDAKLTDRERNLLRKLHEELAQREQDRDGPARGSAEQVTATSDSSASGRRHDARVATMPATGGFPPMGAAPASGHRSHPPQAH